MRRLRQAGAVLATALLVSGQAAPAGWAAPTPKPKPSRSAKPTRKPQPPPPPPCQQTETGRPASEMTTEPWGQQRLGFTEVWPVTTGEGITVAVVDSGTDTSHPQLRGRVTTYDVTHTLDKDCVGHGTAVAGIIGAQDLRKRHVPFLGVAPGARIISIKMAPQATDNDPHWVADAIRLAAERGAQVINVSSQTLDYPFLRSAVEFAQRKDAVVVAAAGNIKPKDATSVKPAYPAGYPGVISVGASGENSALTDVSNPQFTVSVTAPGQNIISLWPGGTYRADSGTSVAAPFVAGTAALVRAYHRNLDYKQVKHRIEATADGGTATGTGAGMVNPLRAVTDVLPEESGKGGRQAAPAPVSIARPGSGDHFSRDLALALTGGALAVAALVVVGGVVIPAGRRRGWRPGDRV